MLLSILSFVSVAMAIPMNKFIPGICPLAGDLELTWGKTAIHYTMGNPVLTNDVKLYHIYYGNWTDEKKSVLEDFTSTLDKSTWWNIMKKYYFQRSTSAEKVHYTGKLTLSKSVHDDKYSKGYSLSKEDIPTIIRKYVDDGDLTEDSEGIYLFLTSGDVKEELRVGGANFCVQYCGYHITSTFTSGKPFYYAMVGSPDKCMDGCGGPNARVSPNNMPSTDAMISGIAHELAETVSDPESDGRRAWQASNGYENGDMCAYKYGKSSKTSTGASYNYVSDSGKMFLVQQNWDPEVQECAQSA